MGWTPTRREIHPTIIFFSASDRLSPKMVGPRRRLSLLRNGGALVVRMRTRAKAIHTLPCQQWAISDFWKAAPQYGRGNGCPKSQMISLGTRGAAKQLASVPAKIQLSIFRHPRSVATGAT